MLTWIEIDSKAIRHNIKQFRKLIGANIMLMPVIKANAYGHGFLEVAKICQNSREVDRICVVNLDEAIHLIDKKITTKPIVILSFFERDKKNIRRAIRNKVIFPLYDVGTALTLDEIGKEMGMKVRVHIKIDTGASRIGIQASDAYELIWKISKLKYLEIEGAFSHFSSSEHDSKTTREQYKKFKTVIERLEKNNIYIPLQHISCSAAIMGHPYAMGSAVRLGLSMYGIYPNKSSKKVISLKPALSWYTKIIQLKNLPTGAKIGYGGTFTTKRRTRLAILPIGYWDGFDRRLSNRGCVIIGKRKCPVVGRICMNLSMIDVTNTKAKELDDVILIGKSGDVKISIDDLSVSSGTINYEFIDRINPLITRIIK